MDSEINLAQLFRNRAAMYGDAVRWRQQVYGTWLSATWRQNQAIVNSLIAGLDVLGARRGEVIGILSNTRWEWMAADWAILGLGAVSTALYPSQVASNFAFILNDVGARYLFVEGKDQYRTLASIRHEIPHVRKLILFDDAAEIADAADNPWVISFDQLRHLSQRTPAEADAFAAQCAAAIQPHDRAAIIYTSGTTGQPKGAVHTHATLMAQITGCTTMLCTIRPGMVDLLWLPLAHVIARIEHLAGYERGIQTVVTPTVRQLVQHMREVKPDLLFSAPRVYEKAYATILGKVAASSRVKQWLFHWSERTGRQIARLRQEHAPTPPSLRLRYWVGDRLVFRDVRAAFGGRLAFAVTGAAPLAPELIEFFHAAGVLLLEGWGLTETGGGYTLNTVDRYRIGTVGQVYPGHELRMADDGEILLRGPCICAGYHNNPEATAAAFDADGWFHTGDIGALDRDGFLRIVDRKKDLIITAGGENIAPQLVENTLRAIPCVSQACVYGDARPHLVALLTLDHDTVKGWADDHGVRYRDVPDVYGTPQFRAYLDEQVARANSRLAAYEMVRNYAILPEDFTIENELLTPVQKIRRRHIHERYRVQFEALYRPRETPVSQQPQDRGVA